MIWPQCTLPLVRQPNADRALIALAESLVGYEFEWGITDCSVLVTEALAVLAGRTPAELRAGIPPYASRPRAARALATIGGMRRALQALGLIEIGSGFAHTGDLLVDGESAAVVIGSQVLCVPEIAGECVQLAPIARWPCDAVFRLEARS